MATNREELKSRRDDMLLHDDKKGSRYQALAAARRPSRQ